MAVDGVTIRHLVFLFVVALVVTLVCVPIVRKIAIKVDAVDYPNARRVNKEPIPRMGGVAMAIGIFVALAVEIAGEFIFGWAGFYVDPVRSDVNHLGVMLGVFIVTLVGAYDDVKSMKPGPKMLGQIVGATVIVISGLLLSEIANPFGSGYVHFGWFAYPLTVFYLVAFMNVINLIDGLDGLAAGIVAITSVTLFTIAAGRGLIETALLSVALLGATIGFLRYNFNPASIFMGDSGSLTLGAMVGVISLLGVMRAPTFIVLVVPLIVSAIPIIDTAAAIIRRKKNHQPIQQADKNHLHHQLLRKGLSVRKAVLIVYAWTAFLGVGAILMSHMHGIPVLIVFCILMIVSFLIMRWIGIFGSILRHHYSDTGDYHMERDDGPDSENGQEG